MNPWQRNALAITLLLWTLVTFSTGGMREASAQELPDTDWMAYFGSTDLEPRQFTINSAFQQYAQRIKPKGEVVLNGITYRKAVVVHDSGPLANRIFETFTRVAPDGLYERQEDGSDRLLVPRPLHIGQSWAAGATTLTFDGFEEFETFARTIPHCIKITGLGREEFLGRDREARTTKYYERGKGLIYKDDTGTIPVTKILAEYATTSSAEHTHQ